jgi:hypothetical protein
MEVVEGLEGEEGGEIFNVLMQQPDIKCMCAVFYGRICGTRFSSPTLLFVSIILCTLSHSLTKRFIIIY